MNIYLLTRPSELPADAYFSYWVEAVVVADSEKEARLMHPGGFGGLTQMEFERSWIPSDKVLVKQVGIAADGIRSCVLVGRFVAGS